MDFSRKKALVPPAPWPEPDVIIDRSTGLAVEIDSQPDGSEPEQASPKRVSIAADMLARSRHLLNLYGGLVAGFLLFYALADYTAYTTAEQRPGQLIFSNTMNQLWTACFRMAFVLGASLGLLRLFWPELFQFFRSDSATEPDMINTIRYDLTSFQRLCVFLLAFFGLCYLFIMLLQVNLPQTISVGR